ncbi:MAG: NfeD family protein [Candidatus Brocadiia bacterium]
MDPTIFWIIVLFASGLVAMLVELFIPGAIIGTAGFIASIGSIIYAYQSGHTLLATILLFLMLLFVPLFFVLWKSVIGKLFELHETEKDYRSSLQNYEELREKTGRATSPLRPSGTATIEGERHAVVTRGEMIDPGTKVKVVDVSGSRVVVTADETETEKN